MRLFRLLMLGLASAYPLYWTAQFLLFFVPETLLGYWLGQPVQIVSSESLPSACAVSLAFGLIILGLHRILRLTGGLEFLDRLALLSLLAVMPQATLWLAFKFIYPFFDVRFLLLRIIPLYLAAIVAAAISSRSSAAVFDGVPWTEIVASSAAVGLLILAIGLSSRTTGSADLLPPTALTSYHAWAKILKLP